MALFWHCQKKVILRDLLRAFRKMFDFTCFLFIDISLEMGTQIPLQTILTNLRPINPCWLQSAICNGLLTVVAWKNVSTKATMRISMSSYPILDYYFCVKRFCSLLTILITKKQVVDDLLFVMIPTTFHDENLFCTSSKWILIRWRTAKDICA